MMLMFFSLTDQFVVRRHDDDKKWWWQEMMMMMMAFLMKWSKVCLIKKSCVDKPLQKESHIPYLWVFNPKCFQHSKVSIFNSDEDRSQVIQVVPQQMQCCTEVLKSRWFYKMKKKEKYNFVNNLFIYSVFLLYVLQR